MKFILKYKIDIIFRYLIGSFLLLVSLWFALSEKSAEGFKKLNQPDYIRVMVGSLEALAAALFIYKKTVVYGAIGLFGIFIFAIYLHVNANQNAFGLIPWTIGILLILFFHKKRKNNE